MRWNVLISGWACSSFLLQQITADNRNMLTKAVKKARCKHHAIYTEYISIYSIHIYRLWYLKSRKFPFKIEASVIFYELESFPRFLGLIIILHHLICNNYRLASPGNPKLLSDDSLSPDDTHTVQTMTHTHFQENVLLDFLQKRTQMRKNNNNTRHHPL